MRGSATTDQAAASIELLCIQRQPGIVPHKQILRHRSPNAFTFPSIRRGQRHIEPLQPDAQLIEHIIGEPKDIVPLFAGCIADAIAPYDLTASDEQLKGDLSII